MKRPDCHTCHQDQHVITSGLNRPGSQCSRCQACRRSFTPDPKPSNAPWTGAVFGPVAASWGGLTRPSALGSPRPPLPCRLRLPTGRQERAGKLAHLAQMPDAALALVQPFVGGAPLAGAPLCLLLQAVPAALLGSSGLAWMITTPLFATPEKRKVCVHPESKEGSDQLKQGVHPWGQRKNSKLAYQTKYYN